MNGFGGRLWVAAALAVTLALVGACAASPRRPEDGLSGGIPFERIVEAKRDRLPGDVRNWLDANVHRRGTYIKHSGGRSYILVAWGEKPTGGYTVRIEDVAQGRRGEVVVVRLGAPGPDQAVTQALTYPFDLVRTPLLRRSVVFTYRGDLTLTSPLPVKDGRRKAAEPRQSTKNGESEAARSANFLVTSPRAGETIASPVRIAGLAHHLFETAWMT